MPVKLKWTKREWPGPPAMHTATGITYYNRKDGGLENCRITAETQHSGNGWKWTVYDGQEEPKTGVSPTASEAARLAEAMINNLIIEAGARRKQYLRAKEAREQAMREIDEFIAGRS